MSEGMEAARRRADKQRYAWPSEVPTEEECEAAARHSSAGGRAVAEETARDRLRRELRHGHPHLTVEHADRLIDDYARELAEEIRQRAQFLAEDPTFVGAYGREVLDGMRQGADSIDYPVGDG